MQISSPSLAGNITVIVKQAVLLALVHRLFKPSQSYLYSSGTHEFAPYYSGGTASAYTELPY
jgi:hypothetical protein